MSKQGCVNVCMCVPMHVYACMCVWCRGSGERRQKYRAGENRQVIGDREIGTGIKGDRERGRIKGIMKGRNKER